MRRYGKDCRLIAQAFCKLNEQGKCCQHGSEAVDAQLPATRQAVTGCSYGQYMSLLHSAPHPGLEQGMDEKHERVVASFATQGLMDTLGARLGSVTAGEVQIDMPFSSRLSQQNSYVHAGAITSIVDSACGYAAMTEAPPDHGVVTVEFKVNFMRPAIG